jgi:hypothetical protein
MSCPHEYYTQMLLEQRLKIIHRADVPFNIEHDNVGDAVAGVMIK